MSRYFSKTNVSKQCILCCPTADNSFLLNVTLMRGPSAIVESLLFHINYANRFAHFLCPMLYYQWPLRCDFRCITDRGTLSTYTGCMLYWADLVPSGCNSISVFVRHGSSVPDWTVYACHCVSKSSWRSSVRHSQQLGCTTLQTVNLRHPCVLCRWSSLLECLTTLLVVRSFVRLF